MSSFERLKQLVKTIGGLTTISDAEDNFIRQQYSFVPSDYVKILSEIGWGRYPIGFMIYNQPISPSNVFDEETCLNLVGVVLIGDDMQGVSVGFRAGQGETLIEIDSVSPNELIPDVDIVSYLLEWAV